MLPEEPPSRQTKALLAVSVLSGFVTHAYHLFDYPLYLTDEGIYMQQAWSVLRQARLAPYTYVYDHAPGGWLWLAGWVAVLPGQFESLGPAINSGRLLMLLIHVTNVFLLFEITRRLSGSTLAAFIAAFLFNFSPLAVFYQRMVLLDNQMVFWLLLSLYLTLQHRRRVLAALGAGFAFGLALVTKENALFFAPVLFFLIYRQFKLAANGRFSRASWAYAAAAPLSIYVYFAALKNELFPPKMDFNLVHPASGHVSLLYEIWYQLHRSQGSILNRQSSFWVFSLDTWLPKDRFILIGGGVAMLIGFLVWLNDRERNVGFLVGSALTTSYAFYLTRGSVMLSFYVVPLLPLLALNIGMVFGFLLKSWSVSAKVVAATLLIMVLVLPTTGYIWAKNAQGQTQVNDVYRLPLTEMQEEQLAWVRKNISPQSHIIIDDDMWVPLHDVKPYYQHADSHWKAAGDPAVRDKEYQRNWQHVDYIVMSNKMRDAMVQNNGGGNDETWLLDALDNHSHRVWDLHRGDIELQVYQIDKGS